VAALTVQTTGYGAAQAAYLAAGWADVLPLPAGQKSAPPSGFTGPTGRTPDTAQLATWRRERADGNLALHLPPGVLALDVDAYGDKPGGATLADLTARLGELPPTWRATSRLDDDVTGKYLFRVPEGLRWPGSLPGIDLIHTGVRYVMAWPSVHPNGGLCRWFAPSGELADAGAVPVPADLPELPEAWVARLTGGEAERPQDSRGPSMDVDALLTDGEPCPAVLKVAGTYDAVTAQGTARHDAMLSAVLRLVRLGDQGHAGTRQAYADLHAVFVETVAPDRDGGEREAEAEWQRAERGAVVRVTGDPTPAADRRCCGEPETVAAPLNLPAEFWQARPALSHVRQAAHSRGRSPDAVLGSLLARLSAMCSHELRFDAGQGTGSLNLFTAVVGKSGTGKSSGVAVARELIDAPPWLFGDAFRDGLPLGSGEGLAESYMGAVAVETGEVKKSGPNKGEPKMEIKRRQVRHNVFVYVDEGQTLTAQAGRSGATIGPALRSAWVGELLGQANARDETTRLIPAGSYALGLVIGYQPGTAGELLADTDAGTPQRFLWLSSTDPGIPDQRVEWPGQLDVDLAEPSGDLFASGRERPRTGVVTFADAIKDELWTANLARNRGTDGDDNELNSHVALMRCKVAALLALLDGRGEVTEDDWHLSALLWATSCAVRDSLVTAGREAAQREREARDDAAVSRATRTAVATAQASSTVERVARHLAVKVHAKGAQTHGYARKLLRSTDRYLFREAVEHAVGLGWLTEDDGKVAPGSSRPVSA
jgi:hypothetical protein